MATSCTLTHDNVCALDVEKEINPTAQVICFLTRPKCSKHKDVATSCLILVVYTVSLATAWTWRVWGQMLTSYILLDWENPTPHQ